MPASGVYFTQSRAACVHTSREFPTHSCFALKHSEGHPRGAGFAFCYVRSRRCWHQGAGYSQTAQLLDILATLQAERAALIDYIFYAYYEAGLDRSQMELCHVPERQGPSQPVGPSVSDQQMIQWSKGGGRYTLYDRSRSSKSSHSIRFGTRAKEK